MRRWSSAVSPCSKLSSHCLALFNHCILVCLTLFLILAHGLISIECPMPAKSKTRAQKKPAAKGLARKELEVAQKVLPVRKATSRKRVTLGQENHSPVTAAPASVTLLASTPTGTQTSATRTHTGAQPVAPILDKGMLTCYYHPQLTALTGNATPVAVSEVSQDLSPVEMDTVMSPEVAAEFASLRGEYSTRFVRASKINFFFSSGRCSPRSSRGSG